MRAAKLSVVATAAVLVAAMVYVVFVRDPQPVDISWRTVRVEIGDPKQVRVTFEVEKPPLETAECQVTAFDAEKDDAGRLTGIVVGPRADNARTTTLTVAVPTPFEPAATAGVATCHLTGTR